MRDFRDAKAMAQTLREQLNARSVSLTHSESQELIARVLGFRDWNVLAARIAATEPVAAERGQSTSFDNARIPVIAMQDLVYFPHMTFSIFIGREDTRRGVEFALAGDRRMLVVAQRQPVENDPNTLESLYSVGVTVRVNNRQTQVDGVLKVSISGLQRMKITGLSHGDFLSAEAVPIEEARGASAEAAAFSRAVLDAYQVYAKVDFSDLPPGPRARHGLPSIGDPSLLADTVAPLLAIGVDEMQRLLEMSDVVRRLEMILELMKASDGK
jgi:ATP-dependent Lon protease